MVIIHNNVRPTSVYDSGELSLLSLIINREDMPMNPPDTYSFVNTILLFSLCKLFFLIWYCFISVIIIIIFDLERNFYLKLDWRPAGVRIRVDRTKESRLPVWTPSD